MRALTVLVTKRNSLQIKFQLHHFQGMAEETGLLDTRVTESFIDHKTVARLRLGTQKLAVPRPIFNVDGSANKHGTITHVTYCTS